MYNPLTTRLPWNLDWNLLRTYLVIVETGSVTSAANKLGRTQPSVSSALKRLEETLDCRLIDRHTRGFEPTPAGQLLFQECRKAFGIVSDCALFCVYYKLKSSLDEVSNAFVYPLEAQIICGAI